MRALKVVAVTLALSLAVATRAAAGGDSPDDTKQLQGTWAIDPASYKDEKNKEVREDLSMLRVVFDDDVVTMTRPRRFEVNGKAKIELTKEKMTFRLDPSKSPKQIDFINAMQEEVQGIYELEKDSLKLCFDRKRPIKFAAGKDGPEILMLIRKKAGVLPAQTTADRQRADKHKEQAREAALKFVKAVEAKDLDALLSVAEVPFAGSITEKEHQVIEDRGDLKKTLQRYLENAKDADKELKIREVRTYEEFAKRPAGEMVVELLLPVLEKLHLAKDDVVIVDSKGTAYYVRVRDGKARLAALFK
jgi:uncharacterized protein (TIGR03067 family)